MNTPLHFEDLAQVRLPARPLHLAIGMFDGVHVGHRAVIAAAAASARLSKGLSGVLTFWPHPSVLFRPAAPARLIFDRAAKRRRLDSLGLDFVVEQNFTAEFARTTAAEFVQFLRRCLPQLATVYVGENFRFGRGREGDVALLVGEGRRIGLTVHIVPRLNRGGEPVSSSRIRTLLEQGSVEEANDLLGECYAAEGVVQAGRKLGRTLGFPTLNFAWEPDLKPRYGAYAVAVNAGGGATLRGVANYGLRPTVEQTARPLLEIHLLDASTLTYGDQISVHWLHFLRPEAKFSSVDELRAQIVRDCENALKYFAQAERGAKPNNA